MEFVEPGLDAVFEDFFLPVDLDQLTNELWKDGQWLQWPGREASETVYLNASQMEGFIKHVAEEAESVMRSTSVDFKNSRIWSTMFLDKPSPSEKSDSPEMPDLVLLDKDVNRKDASWKNIISVMDVRHTYETTKETHARMTRYAERIFEQQPGRRFVIAISLIQENVEVRIFDRSGSLICFDSESSFHDDPYDILRIILGTLYFDRQELGFDTTLYHKDCDESGRKHTYMKVQGVEYRVETIYHERDMHGRGTVCFSGVSQVDDSVVVIKDQWTDAFTTNKELEILEHLNEGEESSVCTPDGVRVIPKVIAKELVKIKCPEYVNGHCVLTDVEDSTAIFRDTDNSRCTILAHWRIVMAPFAQKIQVFPSLEGLISIFSDVVHAIRIAHSKGVLHRDISHRNILWYYHEGSPRGLLIDYDAAVFAEEDAKSVGIGTYRYLSLNRLDKSDDCPHDYCEDLESLFYVMCFVLSIYDGPSYTPRTFPPGSSGDELDVVHWHVDEEWKPATAYKMHKIKLRSIRSAETRLFNNIAPSFDVFKDCLRRLHELLFSPSAYVWEPERELSAEKAPTLKKRYETCEPEELDDIKQRFNKEVNIWDRPPSIVFDSFLETFEKTSEKLRNRGDTKLEDKVADVEKLEKNLSEPTPTPMDEIVGENVDDTQKAVMKDVETEIIGNGPSPQVIESVALALQAIPSVPNLRKRKASEKENPETENMKRRRNKTELAPLQPSAAANVPVGEVGIEKEKHYVPLEFEAKINAPLDT